MAITPLAIIHAETGLDNAEYELDAEVRPDAVKSGAYSFRFRGSDMLKKLFPLTTQHRIGLFIRHNGANAISSNPSVVSCFNEVVHVWGLRFTGQERLLLQTGSGYDTVDSVYHVPFTRRNRWIFVGIDVNIAVDGWIKVYVDGLEVLSTTGDLTGIGSGINNVIMGSVPDPTTVIFSDWWQNSAYWDNIYVDDTAGELAPVCPPDKRFIWIKPNADTLPNQWVSSSGAASNYLNINQIPLSSVQYLRSSAAGETEFYTLETTAPPENFTTNAIYLQAWAQKTNAAIGTQLRLKTGTSTGAALDLSSDWDLITQRFEETDLTQEFGFESAGSFS